MSAITNYMNNITPSVQNPKDVVNSIDSMTYNQYESSNPLRIKYQHVDSFENKNVKKTVLAAQGVGAEVYSLYANPFYLFHKLILIGKYMIKEYNQIAMRMIIQDNLNKIKYDDIPKNAASESIKTSE